MIDIRERTKNYVKDNFNITPETTETMFDMGLIREDIARRVLIRDEYQRKSPLKKKTELKIYLGEKWSVSLSTVEKIITEGHELFP